MSIWPASNDYTASIQSPNLCFNDQELKNAVVERNRLTGMPKVWTGNFAQVYELRGPTSRWAVKCFTRSNTELQSRYLSLSTAIAHSNLPYFIDFRFLVDEMLVSGKRYPVVKMKWLDGQPLDKFVESNLHVPQALLNTAANLNKLVRDLEERGFAHGDLQHGNVVVTPSGLKLVDYDGMFVPAFAGKPAGEIGLPSYQHPKRSPTDFGVGLDRFSLLVICTGLCAVAVEPGLWYEFGTGDNLLFTARDFRDPQDSKLFKRILASSDSQLSSFARLLQTACLQSPMAVALPEGEISVRGQTPWWVTDRGVTQSATGHRDQPAGGSTRRAWRLPHRGAPVLVPLGAGVLGIAGLLGPQAGAIAALIGGLGYLIQRAMSFNALPALSRRRELQRKLDGLRRELLGLNPNKNDIERQLAVLRQGENSERGQALLRHQNAHLAHGLSGVPIEAIRSISGIGPAIVNNYRSVGVNNAWQLRQHRSAVSGVGQKRRAQILGLLAEWERSARVGIPTTLPRDEEAQIVAAFTKRRSPLADQLGVLNKRIFVISTEVSQAEWEIRQLRVPSFGEFLKNTL